MARVETPTDAAQEPVGLDPFLEFLKLHRMIGSESKNDCDNDGGVLGAGKIVDFGTDVLVETVVVDVCGELFPDPIIQSDCPGYNFEQSSPGFKVNKIE